MTDKVELKGIKFDEEKEELNVYISNQLIECIPKIDFEAKIINLEGEKIVVLKIQESDDKPIQSIGGAFYVRENGKSESISRSHLRDIFLLRDIEIQRRESLLFEIDYMLEIIKGERKEPNKFPPPFYKFRIEELLNAISNYHFYLKGGAKEKIKGLQKSFADLKKEEKYFEMFSPKLIIDLAEIMVRGDKLDDTTSLSNRPYYKRLNESIDPILTNIKVALENLKTSINKKLLKN